MKKDDLKELTIEELLKKEKSLKTNTWILSAVLIALYSITIYISIEDSKFTPGLVIAIALSATLPGKFKKIKAIKSEINER